MKHRNLKLLVLLSLMVLQQLQAQDERYALDYMDAVSRYAALFSGNRQQLLTVSTENHQYFKDEDYTIGKLLYGGVVYPDISLRWDLYRDELVIFSPTNFNLVLNNEHLGFAEMYGYHIFYFRPDGLKGCPSAGNYIRLYSGENLLLLEKLTNTFMRKEDHNKMIYYFTLSTNFYLQKDGAYYKIKSSRTLLKTLDTHRKELKRFIRANELKYRRDAEKLVLQTVMEHEKLSRL